MRRFYKEVTISQEDKWHFIMLDEKKVRTPSRQFLKLPTPSLAQAIADEWRGQGEEIRPAAMPLGQLANSAIDQTPPNRERVIEQVAAYAGTDLLCYRVAAPPDLAERQAAGWQPLLDWSEGELGARLEVTTDLAPLVQSDRSLLAVFTAVAGLDDYTLTGLSAATAACGSVVLGLALQRGRLGAGEACALAQLDEQYQSEQWGDDAEARSRRDAVRHAIEVAATFMALSQDAGEA